MLGKVTRQKLARADNLPIHEIQLAGDQLCKRRLSVSVLAEKRDSIVRIDAQGDARENGSSDLVSHGRAVHRKQRRTCRLALRNLNGSDMLVDRQLDFFELGDHLEAALGLTGFRLLVAEAVDKRLHVLAPLVYLLCGRRIERALLGTRFDEGVVIARIK